MKRVVVVWSPIVLWVLFSSQTAWSASTLLRYDGAAQFEITTSSGRHIFIDVAAPGDLAVEPGDQDILLTTHLHSDHWDRVFKEDFPGKQILIGKGHLKYPDVEIYGIPSAHHPNDGIVESRATNTIYLIITNGLRIAHFGDIGQKALTQQQLQALGTIDVAITQFVNPTYSDMTVENRKGFRLMQQINPRVVIPTSHAGLEALKTAKTYWPCLALDAEEISLSSKELPRETHLLLMGHLAPIALEELNYTAWDSRTK